MVVAAVEGEREYFGENDEDEEGVVAVVAAAAAVFIGAMDPLLPLSPSSGAKLFTSNASKERGNKTVFAPPAAAAPPPPFLSLVAAAAAASSLEVVL